eukprot:scaffold2325_cov193-Alexandrium_tamarense.AAC.3
MDGICLRLFDVYNGWAERKVLDEDTLLARDRNKRQKQTDDVFLGTEILCDFDEHSNSGKSAVIHRKLRGAVESIKRTFSK